jgi:hypothetical protein
MDLEECTMVLLPQIIDKHSWVLNNAGSLILKRIRHLTSCPK